MNYKEYNDYELLYHISEKNEDAIDIMYKKYEPLINKIAQKLLKYAKGTGIEDSDLIQEGMLGLNNAIDTFTDLKDASFFTYAKTCIERKMISYIVFLRRQKRRALNEAISFDDIDEYGNDLNLEFFLKDDTINPESILVDIENKEEFLKHTNEVLTNFELQVLELKKDGFDYKEIADILEKDPKSIDNALQRIKNKLKEKGE